MHLCVWRNESRAPGKKREKDGSTSHTAHAFLSLEGFIVLNAGISWPRVASIFTANSFWIFDVACSLKKKHLYFLHALSFTSVRCLKWYKYFQGISGCCCITLD